MNISFELNGKPATLEIEQRETLAEVLRARCRLTGVKISCEAQVCGSCTVLVDGLPVSSCTLLAYEVRGKRVTTIEGLADDAGRLHPLQQAFLDNFAFQCGFCTPGMILAAKALLDENAPCHGRGNHRAHERQPVPLHGLLADSESDPPGRGGNARAKSEGPRANSPSSIIPFRAATAFQSYGKRHLCERHGRWNTWPGQRFCAARLRARGFFPSTLRRPRPSPA